MSDLIRVCSVDDVEDGEVIQVIPDVEGLPSLAVYRVNDTEYYVSDDTCTHGAASLGEEGYLEGYIIECTWHEGKFDIRDGSVVAMPCEIPLKVYPVTVKDGDVCITV